MFGDGCPTPASVGLEGQGAILTARPPWFGACAFLVDGSAAGNKGAVLGGKRPRRSTRVVWEVRRRHKCQRRQVRGVEEGGGACATLASAIFAAGLINVGLTASFAVECAPLVAESVVSCHGFGFAAVERVVQVG